MEADDTVMNFQLPARSVRAKLRILIKYQRETRGKKNRVRRVNIDIEACQSAANGGCQQVGMLNVAVRHTKWQNYVLPSSLIRDAMRSGNGSLTLKISCSSCSKPGPHPVLIFRSSKKQRGSQVRRAAGVTNNQRFNKRRPYLVVRIKQQRKTRSLRNLLRTRVQDACEAEAVPEAVSADPCERHTVAINFNDFGWDFIIHPVQIAAYSYCSGSCPRDNGGRRSHDDYSRAAPVTTCCQATQTRHLQIIYIDSNDKIKTTSIEKFFSEQCGCV